jgi:uncharacterized protein (TIGR03083 family)
MSGKRTRIDAMEIGEHIAALRHNGALMTAVAAELPPDASVPTCPEWNLRQLIRHQGLVHRWATAHLRDARTTMLPDDELERTNPLPADADLARWLAEGLAALTAALESAPADLDCWTFLPAPTAVRFWARRQAHETAIHRADAQAAAGAIAPFPAEFAVDGIDELLFGFFSRRWGKRPISDQPKRLSLTATDAGVDWLVTVGPERATTVRGAGAADTRVAAPASDLYLFLWNRLPVSAVDTAGDQDLLELWRREARIQWR